MRDDSGCEAQALCSGGGETSQGRRERKKMKKSKKSQKSEIYVMSFPKSAFSNGAVEEIVEKFQAAGVTLIPVCFNNNAVTPPRFDQLRLEH
jgi:hypothetical protein